MNFDKPYIPNYLTEAILVTIFCCFPVGIVAIVYAAQVDGQIRMGNYDNARSLSDNARAWSMITAILGVCTCCVFAGLWKLGHLPVLPPWR